MSLPAAILRDLTGIVGSDWVLSAPEDLLCYSYDGTFCEGRPDVAVLPGSVEEVAAIVQLAHREGIPIIARGMGSGLAAASIPFEGGIALTLTRLNRIIEIDPVDMVAVVEAGVITGDLQQAVEAQGLFYPPDPSSLKHCTIGGNIACNAGGPRCLKYGVTRDYVLALRAVLADGRTVRVGARTAKNATGYSLVQLFVGSEGTLGVITEAALRLLPLPRAVQTVLAEFPRLTDACEAVTAVLQAGVRPATLELMDETAIRCVEEYLRLGLPLDAEAILLVECDGDEARVAEEARSVAALCREHHASRVRTAQSPQDRGDLWRARRAISGSLSRQRPNKLGEDIVVPRHAIPAMVARLKEIGRRYALPIVIFGHAGDGNLHPNILFDRRDPAEWSRVQEASSAIFAAAVELGGTLSGEHGVGVLKREFLPLAVDPVAIEAMRAVKRALDPKGILNPGKVVG
ncbi:MAG: FAD-binding protein [Anaerolineae bacterium]|nr:FAD-binding protein [Anaerolineae bacterium]